MPLIPFSYCSLGMASIVAFAWREEAAFKLAASEVVFRVASEFGVTKEERDKSLQSQTRLRVLYPIPPLEFSADFGSVLVELIPPDADVVPLERLRLAAMRGAQDACNVRSLEPPLSALLSALPENLQRHGRGAALRFRQDLSSGYINSHILLNDGA